MTTKDNDPETDVKSLDSTSESVSKVRMVATKVKVLKSPEVVKIYFASIRDISLQDRVFGPLTETETQELLAGLQSIPKTSATGKL